MVEADALKAEMGRENTSNWSALLSTMKTRKNGASQKSLIPFSNDTFSHEYSTKVSIRGGYLQRNQRTALGAMQISVTRPIVTRHAG